MASVSELRQALADSMSSVYGLRSSATVPDAPRPPVAVVMPDRIEYDLNARRGADTFYFTRHAAGGPCRRPFRTEQP
jgi:hypothetical protein